jgi:hypothetical protein
VATIRPTSDPFWFVVFGGPSHILSGTILSAHADAVDLAARVFNIALFYLHGGHYHFFVPPVIPYFYPAGPPKGALWFGDTANAHYIAGIENNADSITYGTDMAVLANLWARGTVGGGFLLDIGA